MKDKGTSAIITMMTKNIRTKADFLFTGAKVQIKSYFRERLTQIITELMILFKHVNPTKEALKTRLAEFLQTTCRLFYSTFQIYMRF